MLHRLDSCEFKRNFVTLASEARELYLGTRITEFDHVPSSLEFLRDFVSQNKPLIIRGGCKHWPAIKKWSNDYLRKTMGNKLVTVAVTPNGYADAVCDGVFTLPEEIQMPLTNFLDILEQHEQISDGNWIGSKHLKYSSQSVYYLQKQNSCLTTEFLDLLGDVENYFPWAEEAFGCKPDAVNFWMGEGRAITSLHKDNYENIYCVVKGSKTFTLLPPTDQPFIPYGNFPIMKYVSNKDGSLRLDHVPGKVRWTSVNPTEPLMRSKINPFDVTLNSGDILYLPSLWFHHVRQTHGCIAVNYWHDMAYDIKYNYFKFVESLVNSCSTGKEHNEDDTM